VEPGKETLDDALGDDSMPPRRANIGRIEQV